MLFKNIETLEYVGKFGNANPHYISDWVQSEKTGDSANSDPFVPRTGTCNFPSTMIVQVFYSKINTVNNPQYQILKVQYYYQSQDK